MSVNAQQRHVKGRRCPICDGADGDPRGKGRRCNGFTSNDDYVHCSREELAGAIDANGAGLYAHRMHGSCHCGQTHGEARSGARASAIEATYDYTDVRGVLLFQVVRKSGKQFRQRKPDGAGGWIWKLGDVPRVPYRLRELAEDEADRVVHIVEGEKDADTLTSRGFLATCNPGGAGKWSAVADVARTVLEDRDVTVVADDDEVGRKHAHDVASRLRPVVRSMRVVVPPAPYKDVTDLLVAGGSIEQLLTLAEPTEQPTPDPEHAYDDCEPDPDWAEHVDAPEPVEATRMRVGPGFTLVRGDHVEIAEHYSSTLAPVGEALYDEGATYLYEREHGLFRAIDEAEESVIVQRYAGTPAGPKSKPLDLRAGDVGGILKLARHRLEERSFFAGAPPGLAFADVFVEVTANGTTARAHSPSHRARHGYPFAVASLTEPARFLTFMSDLFVGDADAKEKIALLQEFAGASLLGVAPRFQLCLVLKGDGANGKSTLLAILKSAFPPGTLVAIPPQRWTDQYRRAALAGALLNAVSELPENDILDSETFKAIVVGDEVEGRHIYKPLFHFVPRAGHMFGANKLPSAADTTHGFWRRFAILTFNRMFEGADANVNLADEIIALERAGVVGWMLEGAERLMARGRYVVPSSSAEILAAWKRTSNAVAIFVDECTRGIKGEETGTPAAMLYAQFRSWCEKNGHRSMSNTKFGSRMRELGKASEKGRAANRYPVTFTGDAA